MLFLNRLSLFFSLFAFSQSLLYGSASFESWGGIVSHFYYTYIDVDFTKFIPKEKLGHESAFLLNFQIESGSNDILFFDFFIRSQEKPYSQDFLRKEFIKKFKENHTVFKENDTQGALKPKNDQCFVKRLLNPFKYSRIRVFTHFYQVNTLSLEISAICMGHSTKLLSLKSSQIPMTVPITHYKTHLPESEEDGRRFYAGFSSQHLARNLRFQVEPEPLYTVRFLTLPRTGTHVIANTLAEILGEFLILFPRFSGQLWGTSSHDYKQGEIRSAYKHSRLSVSHYVPPNQIPSRIIYTFRDPVEFIHSSFSSSLHQSLSCAYEPAKPGYEKEPLFVKFIQVKILQMNAIFENLYDLVPSPLYLRFDDTLSDPYATFCTIISFMNAFPCELSIGWKVKEVLETQGIKSSYKRTGLNETQENKEEKWKKVFEFYGQKLVFMVYNNPGVRNFIHFYDYTERYREFLGVNDKQRKDYEDFRVKNGQSLRRVLSLTEEAVPSIKHNRKWEKWDLVPAPQTEKILNHDVFKKYKVCEN